MPVQQGTYLGLSRTDYAFMFHRDPSRNIEQAFFYCALILLQLLMLAHVFTDLVRTHTQTARKQNRRRMHQNSDPFDV